MPSRATRVQRLGEDQARLGRGLHACATGAQVGVVAVVQGG
jgi:hypothetical protein